MGRLNINEEEVKRPLFTHFSHEHPLELANLLERSQVTCFGCGLNILPSKDYYTCKNCTFSLHHICYNMPRKIRHPADPNHDLILILSPSFECKACGNPGSGLSYNCLICLQNYHSLCSVKPLSTFHYSHPHTLKLEFSPPYDGIKAFRCDICKNPGFDYWLYRCAACEFDVHLNCAKSNQKPQAHTMVPSNLDFEASTTRSSGSSMVTSQSRPSATYVNQGSHYPNGNNSNLAGLSGSNQAAFVMSNEMLMTAPHEASTNTTRSLMGTSQFRPSVTYINQGNNYPHGVQPNGNSFNVAGTYGSNQAAFVQPNGVPMAVPQANPGFGYRNQMGFGSNQGGMKGLLVGSVAAGMGQELGQEIVQGVTNGWGDGSGSSDHGGESDILSSWIGGSDYY